LVLRNPSINFANNVLSPTISALSFLFFSLIIIPT
jgi:hypothetical protein